MTALSQASIGTIDTIKWVINKSDVNIAATYGLRPNKEIKVVSSFGGNVIVRSGNRLIALGKEIAEHIKL